jgi:glycosyltransferase involved in cell wall biosynthesis
MSTSPARPGPLRLSVALATCQGERFLSQQLESIAAQTRLPDELVVRDDASTDGTVRLLQRFAHAAPFPVRIAVNERRGGSTPNFNRVIAECSGELIALADQDDLWEPQKLERLEESFRRVPEAGFVFSNAILIGPAGEALGGTLWDVIGLGTREEQAYAWGGAFERLLRRHRVTGATLAFRSTYRDCLLPIPPGWVHDAWIALILSAFAPCVPLNEPLVRYRQHADQQMGARRRGLFAQFTAARAITADRCEAVAERFRQALERLLEIPGVPVERLNRLRAKIEHHDRRARLRRAAWRTPHVLRAACTGGYRRYDQGWKTIAQDLLL